MIIELKVPDIGGSSNVNVTEVYIKVGDKVNKDDNLAMLETDKATMEVPSEFSGVVTELIVTVGAKVSEGSILAKIEVADVAAAPANAKVETHVPVASAVEPAVANNVPVAQVVETAILVPAKSSANIVDEDSFATAFASPSIRKLARELGVNLGELIGTGRKNRITEDDVKLFVKGVMSGQTSLASSGGNGVGLDLLPWPSVDFAKYGEVEVQAMSRIKKISGANLLRNWVLIPHVTQFDEADITELEEFRQQLNVEYKKSDIKISPLAFIIKAVVFALKKFPEFNSSIDGDNIVYKKYYNIGFAADTPQGLVVPVLKDADKLGLVDIALTTANMAKLARDGKLKPTDMQGGTFTISSLGGIGGTAFTPIVNAPEVAILGLSKSSTKPQWNGKEFAPRLMLPLSLSYDHRIIDGALAAKFTTYLSQVLADIRRLML